MLVYSQEVRWVVVVVVELVVFQRVWCFPRKRLDDWCELVVAMVSHRHRMRIRAQ